MTTMLFQLLGELPIDETAYIKIQPTDNMGMLTKDLDRLYNEGYRYVFIDIFSTFFHINKTLTFLKKINNIRTVLFKHKI